MKTKLTKAEQEIVDWYKVKYRFDTAKTAEDKQAAIKYLREYCKKYKLNYKRQFSHLLINLSIL